MNCSLFLGEEQSPLCFFRKCWPLYISDIDYFLEIFSIRISSSFLNCCISKKKKHSHSNRYLIFSLLHRTILFWRCTFPRPQPVIPCAHLYWVVFVCLLIHFSSFSKQQNQSSMLPPFPFNGLIPYYYSHFFCSVNYFITSFHCKHFHWFPTIFIHLFIIILSQFFLVIVDVQFQLSSN